MSGSLQNKSHFEGWYIPSWQQAQKLGFFLLHSNNNWQFNSYFQLTKYILSTWTTNSVRQYHNAYYLLSQISGIAGKVSSPTILLKQLKMLAVIKKSIYLKVLQSWQGRKKLPDLNVGKTLSTEATFTVIIFADPGKTELSFWWFHSDQDRNQSLGPV